jgi:membrane-bound metal-dependent hydrolase YbcI (DUF457 family)
MADFKTHFAGGTAVGVAAALTSAACGWIDYNQIPFVAMTGIIGGIAPDIDSDSGRAQGILFNLGMLIVPSAIVWRIQPWLPGPEYALAAWVVLALLRFPVQWFFRWYTVHRGMWHSTPAGLAFATVCFLLGGHGQEDLGNMVAHGLAGGLGYFIHVTLDELWSVDFDGRLIRVKKSLGTAYKLVGSDALPNLATWGAVLALVLVAWQTAPVSSFQEALGILRPSDALLSMLAR